MMNTEYSTLLKVKIRPIMGLKLIDDAQLKQTKNVKIRPIMGLKFLYLFCLMDLLES